MHRFKFGGIDKKGIYLDETVMRMCFTHRRTMAKLAMELMNEGKDKKAAEVLRYTAKVIPAYNVPHNYSSGSLDMARVWGMLGQKQEAMDIIGKLWHNSIQYMRWYCSLEGMRFESAENDVLMHFYVLQQVASVAKSIDRKWYEKHLPELTTLADIYQQKGGQLYEE